jgi:hypothetical protein
VAWAIRQLLTPSVRSRAKSLTSRSRAAIFVLSLDLRQPMKPGSGSQEAHHFVNVFFWMATHRSFSIFAILIPLAVLMAPGMGIDYDRGRRTRQRLGI